MTRMYAMLRNTKEAWGSLTRGIHWFVVTLVIIQIPLGFYMVEVYDEYTKTYADDTLVMRTSMGHHTIGLLILAIAVFRITWRLSNQTPRLPAGLKTYQRFLARCTHVFLYVVMIIYPLSGWAALSAYEGEFPIFFFGWEGVPHIVPQVAEGERFDYTFFAEIHRNLWRSGGLLLGLHIFGDFGQDYILGDGIVWRMLMGSPS
ncbi:MAG: cytochrome b/b6 domain-containing protein [Gammaproteobacteria bacterium]|nr:cytochrome b/b6 domain-containing protein [Gammaproteobacteria bacterium]